MTAADWPYPVNAVFNPGATAVNGETMLLARVEDRRGISHLTVARSAKGLDGWSIEPEPLLAPDDETGESSPPNSKLHPKVHTPARWSRASRSERKWARPGLSGDLDKPSDGLEPSTPSLPGMASAGTFGEPLLPQLVPQ